MARLNSKQVKQLQQKKKEQHSDGGSEFEDYSGNEDFEDYKQEGYHPVILGENFNSGKYNVVCKLGWGHFSTVWLIQQKVTTNYFALKIVKSKKSYLECSLDEIDILNELKSNQNNQQWLDTIKMINQIYQGKIQILDQDSFVIDLKEVFFHHGIHGKHQCMVFDLVGPNLLDLIQHFEDEDEFMDLILIKRITRQILIGLDYMHRICGIIHTDIKPENVVLQLDQSNMQELIGLLTIQKKKPLSMRFLKTINNSGNSEKNKKKYEKKKKQKELKKNLEQQNPENEIFIPNQETSQDMDTEQTLQKDLQIIENVKNDENLAEQPQKKQKQKFDRDFLVWKDNIRIDLRNENQKIKIVDFGNGCFEKKHFTERIQTREYRSPEAIIQSEYYPNTDLFSLACMIFEMITNSYLFKPKKGNGYGKSDDHLAQMIETLGPIPKKFALSGKKSRKYFNKDGELLNIKRLRPLNIAEQLIKDYDFEVGDAEDIQDFLTPMLEFDPAKRIDAQTCLKSEWLWSDKPILNNQNQSERSLNE